MIVSIMAIDTTYYNQQQYEEVLDTYDPQYNNQAYNKQNGETIMAPGQANNIYNTNNYVKKYKGLNIYQIPIFNIYNPKTATVTFYISGKSPELSIKIAPAIPNNPAINARGPVPAGTKVYDYSREVFSNFSDVDTIDFVNFLKSKFVNDLTSFKKVIVDTNTMIMDLKNNINNLIGPDFFLKFQDNPQFGQGMYSVLSEIANKLEALRNQGETILAENNARKNNNDNQFSLYRKSSIGDKAWGFNYDPSTNMLHISVMVGNDKQNRIHISLSSKMAGRLISAIESYTSNYCVINMISNLNSELSKTLAHNKIFAPSREQSEQYI